MKLSPKVVLVSLLALGGAGVLTFGQPDTRYEEALLGVAVSQSFGAEAPRVAAEPPAVQALLLDYADDEALLLKARLALLRYPDPARRILPVFGAEPEFQQVLRDYGEAVLPPIGYFMDHDLTSLKLREDLGKRWQDFVSLLDRLLGRPVEAAAPAPALTPEARGWYAVNFIREDGHGFLGQFAVAPDGTADWVQTERVLEGLGDLFAGGVRGLETRWRLGDEIQAADLGWAALDVAVLAGGVKLLKALRAVRLAESGRAAARASGFSGKVALFGSRVLARGGRLAVAVARYGAVPAAVYLMVRYPSLANATLAELAGWLGIAPWVLQLPFWFLVLSLPLWLAGPLLALLAPLLRGLAWLAGWAAKRARAPIAAAGPRPAV